MQFEGRFSKRVQTENKIYVCQEVAGCVHVKILLKPSLGAGIVQFSSARQKEEEVVIRMRPKFEFYNPGSSMKST